MLSRVFLLLSFLAIGGASMAQDVTSQGRQAQVGLGNTIFAAMQREVELRTAVARLEEDIARLKEELTAAVKKVEAPK